MNKGDLARFSETGLADPAGLAGQLLLDGTVDLNGPIFKVGNYPDKKFSMTEAEADEAVAAFSKPVPMDYEHLGGPLDGHLGHVVKLWREGALLKATYRVPAWLAGLAKDKGVKLAVSPEWTMKDKRLNKAAWTLTPRIKGNELVAAFSAAGGRPAGPKKEGRMTATERIKALLVAKGVDPENLSAEDLAQFSDLDTELTKARETTAKTWVESQVAAGKMLPAQKPAALALFSVLSEDDDDGEAVVKFSATDTARSRVEAFKTFVESGPGVTTLTEEQVEAAKFSALPSGKIPEDEAAVTEAERKKLLSQTTLGQQILAEEKEKGK